METAKAVINSVNESIESMINRSKYLVAGWFPRVEVSEE
jgi:hypothetical protein